jgi:3-oxoacyl-[acyl-carrier-protein] synthase-3
MTATMTRATITGFGLAVPEPRLTNRDLESQIDTSDEWIVERTGIRERRIAGDGETTASLGARAGTDAIARAGLTPADIDLLIVATASPEQPIPHTGAFIGEAIGVDCGSFDLGAGCAGFVYGLVTAAAMVGAGANNVLLVGAETLSRIVDPLDRTTRILFGDGAGAAVVSACLRPAGGLLSWDLGCDGSAAGLLEIPAGGSRRPTSAETLAAREQYLKMQGQEVFRRAVRAVVESGRAALERADMKPNDVDWFVPHQANARIIDAAAQRLGIERERTLVNIDRYGNTSSASIPLALFEAVDDGRVRENDVVLCAGFGAGMTWASAVLEWSSR